MNPKGLKGSVRTLRLLVYNYTQKTLKLLREAPRYLRIDFRVYYLYNI